MRVKKSLFIGTSGWNYSHWGNGVFYPLKMPQSSWLEFYSGQFVTVEVNSTFYNVPKKHVCASWKSMVPDNFRFAVKVNKFITHNVRLKNPDIHLANFYEPCSVLGAKLGPILFQFEKHFVIKSDVLVELLEYTKQQKFIKNPMLVFEFRNESCFTDEIVEIMKKYNAAVCFADYIRNEVIDIPETADFIYIRRHGPTTTYNSLYTKEQLEKDANKIKKWRKEKKEVYVYFNNDANGWAVQNARELYDMV